MNEYSAWDRTEHLSWTADTIYRELRGEGPMIVRITEKRISGVVAKAVQDGRFVTVKTQDGTELQLRVTADTDVAGIADRTLVRPGMTLSALYQIPAGVNPVLGYDALEIRSRLSLRPAASRNIFRFREPDGTFGGFRRLQRSRAGCPTMRRGGPVRGLVS